jgi:hypothetical protein
MRRGWSTQCLCWRLVSKRFWSSAAEQNRTVYTELIERLSDLDLGVEIKIGIGELFAFTQCAFCMDDQQCSLSTPCCKLKYEA